MKKLVLFVSLLTLLVLPLALFAEDTSTANKPSTMDELVAPVDSSKCMECHDEIHEDWSKSWHAKAVIDPRTIRTFRTFILRGVDSLPEVKRTILKDMCLMCHAPAATAASDELAAQIADWVVTAVDDEDAAKREAATKELAKLNINCITCHGMKNPVAGKIIPNTIFGPGDAEETPHKEEFGYDTVKSENMKDSTFCEPCHHGCPPGIPSSVCPTQWTSYMEHYVAHGGTKSCQDCHMRDEDWGSHRFPGIYETEFAKKGIELTLHATPTKYIYHLENKAVPAITMNVQAKNVSGHGIPHG